MSTEATYDITFKAKADTQDAKAKLEELNSELKRLQSGPTFGARLQPGMPAPGGAAQWEPSSGEQIAALLKQRTQLHRQMGIVPARPATIEPAADEDEGFLSRLLRKGGRVASSLGMHGASRAASGTAAGIEGAEMMGLGAGAAVAGAAVAAVAVAVAAAGAAMVAGAGQAAELAKELDKLDKPGKSERLHELGDIGEVLNRNGQILLEYGKNWDAVKRKPADFIQGLGTAVAPALNEVAAKLNSVNAAKAGEEFGLLAKGIAQVLNPLSALKTYAESMPDSVKNVASGASNTIGGALDRLLAPVIDNAKMSADWWAALAAKIMGSEKGKQTDSEKEAAERRAKKEIPFEQEVAGEALGLQNKKIMRGLQDPHMQVAENEAELKSELAKTRDIEQEKGTRAAAWKRISELNQERAGLEKNSAKANREAEMEKEIGDATEKGDGQRVRELNYAKTVQGFINRGVDEDTAWEIAGQKDRAGRQPGTVSALARMGGAVGESMDAAGNNARGELNTQRIHDLLTQMQAADREWKGALENCLKMGFKVDQPSSYQ
jgi:hypothetical protein